MLLNIVYVDFSYYVYKKNLHYYSLAHSRGISDKIRYSNYYCEHYKKSVTFFDPYTWMEQFDGTIED